MKIILAYDDKFKYTTGFYCKEALEELGHEVIYKNPVKERNLSCSDYDFVLNVDDDTPYFLNNLWKPNVYWVSDTHRGHIQWRFDKCKKADILFVSQKNALYDFLKVRKKVFLLHHACDPKYHFFSVNEKKFDIGFVGNINSKFHKKRENMFNVLKQNFSNISFKNDLFLNDMAKHYSESKIVFNCTLNNDINMRLFEGMCSSSLVITDLIPELYEVVSKGSVIDYNNEKELVDKISYYLKNDKEREEIAKKGFNEAVSKHTYCHRMKDLIEVVKGMI